jgi:hypothetical protein
MFGTIAIFDKTDLIGTVSSALSLRKPSAASSFVHRHDASWGASKQCLHVARNQVSPPQSHIPQPVTRGYRDPMRAKCRGRTAFSEYATFPLQTE